MRLLMVGCGNMGGAMVHRWLESGCLPQGLTIVKPSPLPDTLAHYDTVRYVASPDTLATNTAFDVILLAAKPYHMAEIIPQYHTFANADTCWISIAAGLPLARYRTWLPENAYMIRAMPNTPVRYGQGVVTLTSNDVNATITDRLQPLWEALGVGIWLEGESQMDIATAIAGSGPAYMFHFLESLQHTGVTHGLSAQTARELAQATMAGSAAMAAHEPATALATLRENVTSKGGTTAAALSILMQDNALRSLVKEAIDTAVKRAAEMARE